MDDVRVNKPKPITSDSTQIESLRLLLFRWKFIDILRWLADWTFYMRSNVQTTLFPPARPLACYGVVDDISLSVHTSHQPPSTTCFCVAHFLDSEHIINFSFRSSYALLTRVSFVFAETKGEHEMAQHWESGGEEAASVTFISPKMLEA